MLISQQCERTHPAGSEIRKELSEITPESMEPYLGKLKRNKVSKLLSKILPGTHGPVYNDDEYTPMTPMQNEPISPAQPTSPMTMSPMSSRSRSVRFSFSPTPDFPSDYGKSSYGAAYSTEKKPFDIGAPYLDTKKDEQNNEKNEDTSTHKEEEKKNQNEGNKQVNESKESNTEIEKANILSISIKTMSDLLNSYEMPTVEEPDTPLSEKSSSQGTTPRKPSPRTSFTSTSSNTSKSNQPINSPTTINITTTPPSSRSTRPTSVIPNSSPFTNYKPVTARQHITHVTTQQRCSTPPPKPARTRPETPTAPPITLVRSALASVHHHSHSSTHISTATVSRNNSFVSNGGASPTRTNHTIVPKRTVWR
eukprot:NODE_3960_length_1253_cov_46.466372_g3474_i0.p1 GENE.NODE_3960_length_1253_cov_46.466372_g3474_i0~~NODE_3960_length_1253_cov_46.466372_g3474_i0.p1  ORF type:complete len:384 (-),score=112.37 NODE_3960_length_1253_cov_46.466372_g3474_i0:100-1197(-)